MTEQSSILAACYAPTLMLNMRKVVVGVMAVLLVCSVPSAQTPTASSESAELAAVRVKFDRTK